MRRLGIGVAVALAFAACGRGGSAKSGGSAGSSGSAEQGDVRTADGVVAAVKENAVQVRTQDGRVLDFPLKDDVKVTLGGGEASTAIVTEGAPVRVSFTEKGERPQLVSIDVEPNVRAGSGQPPAEGRFEANHGNAGAATAPPPGGSAAQQDPRSGQTPRGQQ